MSHKESFGLRLRAARERQGISLASIAERTKVSVSLWEAMERNDFSRWPSGLFARAYVRDFATIVGLDPHEIVDDFCRYFPNGDRRRENAIRAHAEVVDVRPQYCEGELPSEGDRRAAPHPSVVRARPWAFPGGERTRRALGAAIDVLAICGAAFGVSQLSEAGFFAAVGAIGLIYHAVGGALAGRSPGLALSEMLARRVPELVSPVERQMHA